MGNSAPGASAGWFAFSEDATQVILRVHDYRSMGLASDEELVGSICLSPSLEEVGRVSRGVPAQLSVSAGVNLYLEFQASGSGHLGDVRLPLEHIARRCGGSLYHMWLPLNNTHMGPAWSSTSSSRPGGAVFEGTGLADSEGYTLEHFDRALRSAARDARLPMVCLSLCRADLPEAETERYEHGSADLEQKAQRFQSLLQSHQQHARLLQALYRQCRTIHQRRIEDPLADSWSMSTTATMGSGGLQAGARVSNETFVSEMPTLNEGAVFADGTAEDIAKLRQEIESTTTEANARINQATEAIRTLRDRLGAKQAEHARLQQESARCIGDALTLERENEQLARTLERPAAAGGAHEAEGLRREVDRLKEQKEALLLILQDLYGNGADSGAPKGIVEAPSQAEARGPAEPAADLARREAEAQEQWTNMLPRPSELFASGVLDG